MGDPMSGASVDLHALAAMPGFGKAKEVLIAEGLWDPHAASSTERRSYTVYVDAEFTARTVITLTARSRQEAAKLAEAKAAELTIAQWDVEDDPEISISTVLPPGEGTA